MFVSTLSHRWSPDGHWQLGWFCRNLSIASSEEGSFVWQVIWAPIGLRVCYSYFNTQCSNHAQLFTMAPAREHNTETYPCLLYVTVETCVYYMWWLWGYIKTSLERSCDSRFVLRALTIWFHFAHSARANRSTRSKHSRTPRLPLPLRSRASNGTWNYFTVQQRIWGNKRFQRHPALFTLALLNRPTRQNKESRVGTT